MSHTKDWGRKVCCEPLPRWDAHGRRGSEGGRRRRWACVFMKFQKSHFTSKKPSHFHSMWNGTYRWEVAVHVARLLPALHPHSTPHPPSQLGPSTQVPSQLSPALGTERQSPGTAHQRYESGPAQAGRREQAETPEILINQQKQTPAFLLWYHILNLTPPTLLVCSETSRPLLTTDQETQLQAPTQLENKALWVEWVDGLISPLPPTP